MQVAIPRSQVVTPVFENGRTTLVCAEVPAEHLPVRVILEGQVLALGDIERTGNSMSVLGDHTENHIEVDYYITRHIADGGAGAGTALPDLPLYSLISADAGTHATDQGVFDVLIRMVGNSEYDTVYNDPDLLTDNQLHSAITLSVYTDAWVDGERGWWGDSYHPDNPIANSKLWTLLGKPANEENRQLGEEYVKESVQWLIDEGYFDRIDIETQHIANQLDWFAFSLTCQRNGQTVGTYNNLG